MFKKQRTLADIVENFQATVIELEQLGEQKLKSAELKLEEAERLKQEAEKDKEEMTRASVISMNIRKLIAQ